MSDKSLPIIKSVDDLPYYKSDGVYVVHASVVEEVARRWQLCLTLADLVHRHEEYRADLEQRKEDDRKRRMEESA